MKRIAQIESQYARKLPHFGPGDTIKVHYKIKEGDKERIQVFQGTVISRRGSGTGQTFTVRKISSGVGVERVFPLLSPNIDKIERTTIGKVRRAKLYYLRDLTGKATRVKRKMTDKAELKMEEEAKAAAIAAKTAKASTKIEKEKPKAEAAPVEEAPTKEALAEEKADAAPAEKATEEKPAEAAEAKAEETEAKAEEPKAEEKPEAAEEKEEKKE